MSVRLTSPYGGAAIEVHDDLAGRYIEAGWVKSERKAPERESQRSAEQKRPTKKKS